MSTIALISDIHANLVALEAVLADIDAAGISTIICCGDVVGYGPHPAECVRVIRERNIPTVLGNHDFYTINARQVPGFLPDDSRVMDNPVWAGVRFAAESLDDEALDWLISLPPQMPIQGAIVAHAALHDAADWPYLRDLTSARPTLERLEQMTEPVGFFGHTHRQECFGFSPIPEHRSEPFALPEAAACAVVVGSVGQPRNGDSRAAWTCWEPETRTVRFRQTPYDVEATVDAIAACGLPLRSAYRLLTGS